MLRERQARSLKWSSSAGQKARSSLTDGSRELAISLHLFVFGRHLYSLPYREDLGTV
jgi:hypothetical protein